MARKALGKCQINKRMWTNNLSRITERVVDIGTTETLTVVGPH